MQISREAKQKRGTWSNSVFTIEICFFSLNAIMKCSNLLNLFQEFLISCIRRKYIALDEIFAFFYLILLRSKYKNKPCTKRREKKQYTEKNHDVFFFTHQQIFYVISSMTHTINTSKIKKTYTESYCTIKYINSSTSSNEMWTP